MRVKVWLAVLAVAFASCGDGGVASTTTAATATTVTVVATTQTPTTVTVPLTTTTTTTVPTAGLEWERVPYTAEVFGGDQWTTFYEQWVTDGSALLDVASGPYGFVTVGYRAPDPETPTEAAVWVSPDGVAWSPVDQQFDTGSGMMAIATSDDLGMVAVGWGGPGEPDAQVWISADGLTWERIVEASLGGASGQVMWDVVFTEYGVFAVGASGPSDDLDPTVWRSADGREWQRVADAALVDGSMFSVCGCGPGLVAVGASDSGGTSDGAIWTSTDGVRWDLLPDDEGVFDSSHLRVIALTGVGLFAAGHRNVSGGPVASIWRSDNGVDWDLVTGDGPGFPNASIRGLAAIGPRLVAVGYQSTSLAPTAAIWTSVDGAVWERVVVPEVTLPVVSRELWSVAAGSLGFVAVGLEIIRITSGDKATESALGAIWTSLSD